MPTEVSRRRLLIGAGALGVLGACAPAPAATRIATQAGIDRPAIPQRHVDMSIWDTSTSDTALATLNEKIAALSNDTLTVTVGIGPRIVQAIDPTLPGTTELPAFPGDKVDDRHRGGDLMLQVCADDPHLVTRTVEALTSDQLTPRWRQTGFRGPARADGAARNPFGFMDGIVVPRGEQELAKDVWLDNPQGATIAVVRRMRLDMAGFLALPTADQERVFGRRKDTAESLSGGDTVDLGAKSANGEYLIPADAHVRRAHPLTSGSGLMLRRSYSYDDGPDDQGLLFISFQRELRTFVATQHRLAEGDALMRYATTTASASFLVLPSSH